MSKSVTSGTFQSATTPEPPFHHADFCRGKKTATYEDGQAYCASGSDGTCGEDYGSTCCIFVGNDGRPLVTMELPYEAMDPQEMLARCLEGVQAALLAGARVL